MNDGLQTAIRRRLSNEPDAELLRLWVENDRGTYSDETFEAVRSLLAERGVDLPPQNDPPPIAARAPAPPPFVPLSQRDPAAAAFWGGLLRPILWIGVALAASKLLQFAGVVEAFVVDARWKYLNWSEWTTGLMLLDTAVQGVLPVVLLAGVYAVWRWRPVGRHLLLVYAWVSLGQTVLRLAWAIHYFVSSFGDIGYFRGFTGWEPVQPMVYPLVLLFLLRRPQIRELFERHAAAFEVRNREESPQHAGAGIPMTPAPLAGADQREERSC